MVLFANHLSWKESYLRFDILSREHRKQMCFMEMYNPGILQPPTLTFGSFLRKKLYYYTKNKITPIIMFDKQLIPRPKHRRTEVSLKNLIVIVWWPRNNQKWLQNFIMHYIVLKIKNIKLFKLKDKLKGKEYLAIG